jgi:ABC-type dipeptide/oligopeptide/nickel transport system permease component
VPLFLAHTLELTFVAMIVAVLAGLFLGTISAVRKDQPVDHATRFLALAGVSVPIFWLGLILKFALATTYPTEVFTNAGFLAKAVFFFIATMIPLVAGLYLAENLSDERTTWARLGAHVGIFLAVVALLFLATWTFVAVTLLAVGGVAYATIGALKLVHHRRIPPRTWRVAPAVVALGCLALALSPFANAAVAGVFDFIPDLPLGGQFSNELQQAQGEHASLINGPTHVLLVDTLLARDWVAFNDVLKHLVLPAITLGYFSLAIIARMMRSSMLETLGQDFVRTARAKGLDERAVLQRHARRNALIPIATVIGLTFGSLLSGAVLTETIFQWPGLGRWSTSAMGASDTNSVMAFVLLVVVVYLLANLLVDIAYSVIDPRVRLS